MVDKAFSESCLLAETRQRKSGTPAALTLRVPLHIRARLMAKPDKQGRMDMFAYLMLAGDLLTQEN
ncbi:hypothetical protein PsorP6_003850 [Peronosclerospora sorghi]|uniref:Uncharacterized protein n=1 Tax=Peronosclerospora sorghi TaxID=230839 RepID=A0ACC0VMG1_9STRA|nr:hypothetical protein PsorP6_003850 [Peronosclerospora sorghi]